MELGERMKVALRKVLADYEYESEYTHITIVTDDPEKLIAEAVQAILATIREAVEEVLAQPPDRIIDPIPVKDYAKIRSKVLEILDGKEPPCTR